MLFYLLAKLISFALLCIVVFITAQLLRTIETDSFSSCMSAALVCSVFQFAIGWLLYLWMMPNWFWLSACASGVFLLYVTQFFVDGFTVHRVGALKGGLALGVLDGTLQQLCDRLL